MRVALTNLSNKAFESSRFRLNDSARRFGIGEIYSYDFDDLRHTDFYQSNKELLEMPRGIGYWCWKPYVILESLKKLEEGDVLVYSDCGIEIVASLDPLINICSTTEPVLLFANGNLTNAAWTKRDCFVLMGCDSRKYWYGPHADAAFLLVRKSELAVSFISDWLKYCCDTRVNTDRLNTCGKWNLPEFREHRWDQAILSLLAIQYQIGLYRVPTQYGNHYKMPGVRVSGEFNCINQFNQKPVDFYAASPLLNSPYFQLLSHHRTNTNRQVSVTKMNRLVKSLAGFPLRLLKRVAGWLHRKLF